jgi:hypothetical protein
VLQQGEVVNLPGSDEIVTDAAKLSYDAANASYQAAQATANAQSEAALWGTIAGIGQEQSLQQTMDGAPMAPQLVTPAATTPPPLENWYAPRVSPIAALNNSAEALAANPQASWGDRLLGAVLGAATSQAATVDSMISGLYNLPNNVNLGGQYLARASLDQGWENQSIDYLQGGNLLLQSFSTALVFAAPIESAGSSLLDVPDTVTPSATGPFGNVPPSLTSNSGVEISATPGQTTTILGRFGSDMNNIINEQLQYPQTTDFGPKLGGYNVLNVDTTLTGDAFWGTYNQPFLDGAISRGDSISMATPITPDALYNANTGELTTYGREVQYLTSQGYSYDPLLGVMYKH